MREQFAWLRNQHLAQEPMAVEGQQIEGVPADWYGAHSLTDLGLEWAENGYPAQ